MLQVWRQERYYICTQKLKSFNAALQLWTAHLATKKNYLESEENKYASSIPFSEIFSSSS